MARLISGTVTVTTAGTRVAFSSPRSRVTWLKVRATDGNTGTVYLGDSTVSSTAGYPLYQGIDEVLTAVIVPIPEGSSIDLGDVYLDAATNGDKAEYIALTEN